jgi:hypothetical protein
MPISHEVIYQSLYVQGRGALRHELTACLRTGRALLVPRARSRGMRAGDGDFDAAAALRYAANVYAGVNSWGAGISAVPDALADTAFVARSIQDRREFLVQHRLDKTANAAAYPRSQRVEPTLSLKQAVDLAAFGVIRLHGVVSSRRVNSGHSVVQFNRRLRHLLFPPNPRRDRAQRRRGVRRGDPRERLEKVAAIGVQSLADNTAAQLTGQLQAAPLQ